MQLPETYLTKVNNGNALRRTLYKALLILSLVVTLCVFWSLKLTGITMAGEAFCGKDEHVHSESCVLPELICEIEESEPHTHGSECLAQTLCCQLPEEPGHTHGEECHATDGTLSCGLEESAGHTHEESCYIAEEGNYICGLEEQSGHLHTEECYSLPETCSLEEHIHEASCYSNHEADLETSDDWDTMIAQLNLSENIPDNIVKIAQSQLGYQESTLNFQVDEQGIRRGITRYGQWYGNPYGDWSAMFAGFCLHYAGIPDLPVNAGPEAMRLEWEEAGLLVPAADYAPAPSNLLFLDKDGNESADAVAIIVGLETESILAIEGSLEDAVAEVTYPLGDAAILGYGQIPNDPQTQFTPKEGSTLIARTEVFSQELFTEGTHLVVYVQDESGYYALDGNGEIVPVEIDEAGHVYTDIPTPELLLWRIIVLENEEGHRIENLVTGMYLPEYQVSPMAVSTFSVNQTAEEENGNGAYQYARAVDYVVWLDGTNGGLMAYNGSPNRNYTVVGGTAFKLPETWQTPAKYGYQLQGWYDVINGVYYKPGAEVTVTQNMVFYADWIANTYDIGQYNAQVSNTVSTNDFVTTHVFDYGSLFNVLSSNPSVTVSTSSHSEVWTLLRSGGNAYNGEETLGFVFRDWDDGNRDISYPAQHGDWNYPTDDGVLPGIYSPKLGNLLFNTGNAFNPETGTGVIGKTYLGQGDHLFQLMTDPSDPHYGYYFYDSERHAASYNQSAQRFYVYDYLARTSDSANSSGTGKYSDFVPMNSPYANTNGQNIPTYSYDGVKGEYVGTTHYTYDAKYNGSGSSTGNAATNFWFGMSIDIQFYLPNVPGTRDASGEFGNQDLYGKDMHFQFSGDDDVWVFVDGELVLDLGGIHGIESGDINFSSGIVTVNGTQTRTLYDIEAGDHVLTIYYLERGSSQSNCAIYFNLAPRFSFSIQKEDVLTKDVLNGAQFSVYTDKACTQPAELWVSKESHDRQDPATNVFTVTNGVADMWGMGAGNTYYIKETKPPDAAEYTYASGIICLTIDKQGLATYSVELVADGDAGISAGFTVHGFRIDEETQRAYIVATNAPEWVTETTGIWAHKKWNDELSHAGQTVTVYLTVTDPDGTVRRLQEAQLSSENNWKHRWENLPKYAQDGVTPIRYGVEEAYVSGYYSKVEETDEFTVSTTVWSPTTSLENGKTYILKTANGCLSTRNTNSDTGFQWVTEDTAKSSLLALWTVTTSGNKVKLTNGAGQTLSFYYGNGRPTDFFGSTGTEENNNVKRFYNYSVSGSSIRLYYAAGRTNYYLTGSMNSSGKFSYSTGSGSALLITPMTKTTTTVTEKVEGYAYEIVNTPLDKETSMTVRKHWDYGFSHLTAEHEKLQVTVALLANGKDTGRTVTLSLKNGWVDTFRGLPYADESGTPIVYTVEERFEHGDWISRGGEVIVSDGDPPVYSTTITNVYRWGNGALLPSTGSPARLMYILCGGFIMLSSLVYGIGSRRKRERRLR